MYGHYQACKNLFHSSLCTCKNQGTNIVMSIYINGHQSLWTISKKQVLFLPHWPPCYVWPNDTRLPDKLWRSKDLIWQMGAGRFVFKKANKKSLELI